MQPRASPWLSPNVVTVKSFPNVFPDIGRWYQIAEGRWSDRRARRRSHPSRRRDLAGALETIDHLIYRGESAIGILLAAVVPTVRRLLVARELADRHGVTGGRSFRNFESQVARLPAEAVAHLPRKKDGSISCYPVFLAASEMRGFSGEQLREGLAECLAANRALVTSSLEPRLVLERLVVRLVSRAA